MKETYRLLPVYTGDVSGIASALYELGGMVVIHDPSGCNSTYNTHDELRWYETESNIFISGLHMRDAVLGNDKKFIADILEAADGIDPAPKFIAICNSPVPFLNGTDFAGISRIIERESGIPTFYVPSNGMHDYVTGVQRAFLEYAKKMPKPETSAGSGPAGLSNERAMDVSADLNSLPGQEKTNTRLLNLLGLTPLSFSHREEVPTLTARLKERGFSINSVWTMGENAAYIEKSGTAAANLVLSETALPLAKYLEETFGTPYVVGCPVSPAAMDAVETALKEAIEAGRSGAKIYGGSHPCGRHLSVYIGEAVLSSSLAAFDPEADETVVLCPFEGGRELLAENGKYICGEEGYLNALSGIERSHPGSEVTVHADPMYGLFLPDTINFVPEPVLAMSGRQYQGHFINHFAW